MTKVRMFAYQQHQIQNPWFDAPPWAWEIFELGLAILSNQEKIMATLDQVLQDVTDESTAIDSVSALIAGLQKQLADALSGATLSTDTQAKVDAIFNAAETNKAKIAAALANNVPAQAPPAATQTTPASS